VTILEAWCNHTVTAKFAPQQLKNCCFTCENLCRFRMPWTRATRPASGSCQSRLLRHRSPGTVSVQLMTLVEARATKYKPRLLVGERRMGTALD